MHLASAEHLRVFALQWAHPRARAQHHSKPRVAPIEPCDVPLVEPRNDMEELLYALRCLVPKERG